MFLIIKTNLRFKEMKQNLIFDSNSELGKYSNSISIKSSSNTRRATKLNVKSESAFHYKRFFFLFEKEKEAGEKFCEMYSHIKTYY